MTIEFDTSLDERGQRKTNLHPIESEPGAYEVQLSAKMIKVTVKDAASSSMKLVTSDGDFLDMDSTTTRNAQLSVSFHKPDAITTTTLQRLELLGELFLEVKKVIHRREEKFTFKVTVRR